MKKQVIVLMAAAVALGITSNASALLFDQNVTSNAIFGSGNTNGSFTVDRDNGIELGLRGKLRHNGAGAPENTFNSNGDGTYSFAAGVAPTQSSPTAVWSFEWSINSNFDGSNDLLGGNLNDLTYELCLDYDPTQGTNFLTFDPINAANPGTPGGYWDHSIGDNGTAQGAGLEATNIAIDNTNAVTIAASHAARASYYDNLIANNNLAQQSWKAHWYIPSFNPTLDGTYDIYLKASRGGSEVARTSIQIIVGAGGAPIPEPATMTLLGLGLAGLGVRFRKRKSA